MDQHPDQNNMPPEDNPIKEAAMAALGAISSAVEKVADVIGDAVSKENREKYAKKGEETFSTIKDKSEDLLHQVKDFGTQTFDKVKSAMEDPLTKPYTTFDSAREALGFALDALQKEAADAGKVLRDGLEEEETGPWAEALITSLHDRTELAVRLARHLHSLTRKDEPSSTQSDDTFFDQPVDGEIPYDSPTAPTDESDRIEKPPADADQASPSSPDMDSNTNVLKTDLKNEHLQQSVPPERG